MSSSESNFLAKNDLSDYNSVWYTLNDLLHYKSRCIYSWAGSGGGGKGQNITEFEGGKIFALVSEYIEGKVKVF